MSICPYPADFQERFWAKVATGDKCWLWTASTDRKGYGQIKTPGKLKRAHRVSWELTKGPIPEGMCVLHHCDTPLCVNPKHLFVGTVADNNRDMSKKGRNYLQRPDVHRTGDDHWSHRNPEKVMRGEKVHTAILTAEKVREMRSKHASGVKQSVLAKEYGVTKHVVSAVICRKNWKSV